MTDSIVERLVIANRVLANEGILGGVGHVSVRTDDGLLISQSRSPAFVTDDDLIHMNLNGTVLDNEDANPYMETTIHRAIYRCYDSVNAVVHHHAPEIMPFTITDVEIKPAFHMGALFYKGVPTFHEYDDKYGRLVVTEDEGERMAAVLDDHRAQLLEGHGANVTGSGLKEAVIATIYFTMNAAYQFQAEQLGEPSYYTEPVASIEAMVEDVILSQLVIDRVWEYFTRRLPKRD